MSSHQEAEQPPINLAEIRAKREKQAREQATRAERMLSAVTDILPYYLNTGDARHIQEIAEELGYDPNLPYDSETCSYHLDLSTSYEASMAVTKALHILLSEVTKWQEDTKSKQHFGVIPDLNLEITKSEHHVQGDPNHRVTMYTIFERDCHEQTPPSVQIDVDQIHDAEPYATQLYFNDPKRLLKEATILPFTPPSKEY